MECSIVKRKNGSITESKEKEITVSQFNVLAPSLCSPKVLNTVDPKFLTWEYRKNNLIKEIVKHKADLMCFQEVEKEKFLELINNCLGKEYEYKYQKRDVYFQYMGSVIFFNSLKFSLINSLGFNLIDGKAHVGIICLLKCKPDKEVLCVVATHPKSGVGYKELREKQVEFLLDKVESFIEEEGFDKEKISIILCGDFNDVKGSGTYQLIVKRKYKNAYKGVKHFTFHKFTKSSLKGGFKSEIDYIFYKNLELKEILESMNFKDIIPKGQTIPNEFYSSDHILLKAKFLLK